MAKRKRPKSGPKQRPRDDDPDPRRKPPSGESAAFTASDDEVAQDDVDDLELTEPTTEGGHDRGGGGATSGVAPAAAAAAAAAPADPAEEIGAGSSASLLAISDSSEDDATAPGADASGASGTGLPPGATDAGDDASASAEAGSRAEAAMPAEPRTAGSPRPSAAFAAAAATHARTPLLSAAEVLRAALDDSKDEIQRLRKARTTAESARELAERRARQTEAEMAKEVDRAEGDAVQLTQAKAEEALERARDRGSAEIRALKRDVRVLRLKLEAATAETTAREKAVLAEVEERLHRARAETEQVTRRSMERILSRVEERANIEIQQLTAEIERLRARGGETAPDEETAAATLARAASAAAASQARELAELEEQMRRAVLDAERTALEATRELERIEDKAKHDLEQAHDEARTLALELEEARVAARLTHKLGEELKRARTEIEALRAELGAARAGSAQADQLALPNPGGPPPPRLAATGTRLIAALDGPAPVSPPVPARPPRPHFVKATQIIDSGKQAVWQDNARRVVQVSVGPGAHGMGSKVGRMRQALSAADLDSDPARLAAAAGEQTESGSSGSSSGPLAPAVGAAQEPPPVPKGRSSDFDPDEWDEL